jgi:hypothetical protein
MNVPAGRQALGSILDRSLFFRDVHILCELYGRVRWRQLSPSARSAPAHIASGTRASGQRIHISARHPAGWRWFGPALRCRAGRYNQNHPERKCSRHSISRYFQFRCIWGRIRPSGTCVSSELHVERLFLCELHLQPKRQAADIYIGVSRSHGGGKHGQHNQRAEPIHGRSAGTKSQWGRSGLRKRRISLHRPGGRWRWR